MAGETTTDRPPALAELAGLDPRIGKLLSRAFEARQQRLPRGETRAELLEAAARLAGPTRYPRHPVLSRPEALAAVRAAIADQLR
jgi:hypothetical protein